MRLRSTATAAVLVLVLAACGSDDTTGDPASATESGTGTASAAPAADDVPVVVASTSIWADITRNVACDGLARVETIVPLGADPHSFEPSLRDRETMERADLIVANGLGLEEGLADTIDAVEQRGVPVVYAADAVDVLSAEEDHDSDDHEDHDDDHDHGGADPHVWFDPDRVIQALPAIADALAGAGVDDGELDRCVAAYSDRLTGLDADIETIVATLPVERRLLVTNHDSLEYFADGYDFEVVGTIIPSSSSLAETNPADLEALADTIERTGVPAIFTETQNSSDDAEALAARVGVDVVELLTGTLDQPGTPGDTYTGWLDGTATTVVEGLSG